MTQYNVILCVDVEVELMMQGGREGGRMGWKRRCHADAGFEWNATNEKGGECAIHIFYGESNVWTI